MPAESTGRSVVLATGNAHKVDEIAAVLRAALPELLVRPRPSDLIDPDETEDSLLGNARLKAAAVGAATGLAALADDSGLEVDALDGRPGVHSARYAGAGATDADNRARLLDELSGVDPARRTARFRTVLVWLEPGGIEIVATGVVEGVIIDAERGTNGFGYDSLFVADDGDGRTFAEMPAADKQAISHRARALAALVEQLTR